MNKKKNFESAVFSSQRLQIITGMLIGSFLIGSLVACSPQSPAATPTPAPTPTTEPPQPETALKNALQRFDEAQSFTVTASTSVKQSNSDGWTSTSTQYVDQINQTSLREYETSFDWDIKHVTLCMSATCYSADATGLLKPVQSTYTIYHPKIESLSKDLSEILDSNYTYVGENTIDGMRVFEYAIRMTKEMVDAYIEAPTQDYFTIKLIEPYPVVTLYVNAEDGYLVKMTEIYNDDWTYESMDEVTNYQAEYTLEHNYSGWNSTTFAVPEYVDIQNTDWQDYNGTYSSLISFQFPKVYSLSEMYDYPTLKTPSGSTMDLRLFMSSIASLSPLDGNERDQETSVAVCNGVVQLWLLPSFTGSPVIESTEWFDMEDLDFCKTVISSDDGRMVEYLFNEPVDYAWANGRMLPATFWISIKPAEGDDVNTIFWDVIQTIQFGASE
ncbi:MAG: hypothetical protein ACYC59_04490 [Anaerolineaceae bacterium]